MVHVQIFSDKELITHELRMCEYRTDTPVSSHATNTRKSAQNNQNLMNSPMWQIDGPYNNAVHPTTSSEGDRAQYIDLQTIQCLNW